MPGQALYLGLDLGTQGFKAVVYNPQSRQIVSRGSCSYGIIESRIPGRAEQSPATWLEVGLQMMLRRSVTYSKADVLQ